MLRYRQIDDKAIIYQSDYIKNGGKQSTYYFIANNYILDEKIERGFCYFCEFISFDGQKIGTDYHYLCDECVLEWNLRKNDLEKVDNISFKINDSFTNPVIKYDSISFDYNGSYCNTICYQMIIPIDIFHYPFLLTLPKDKEDCPCHYYDKQYNNHINFKEEIDCICQNCINFALKLFVNKHYEKYIS